MTPGPDAFDDIARTFRTLTSPLTRIPVDSYIGQGLPDSAGVDDHDVTID